MITSEKTNLEQYIDGLLVKAVTELEEQVVEQMKPISFIIKSKRELTNLFTINNSQYYSLSEKLRTHCALKQIIDLFSDEVSETVKEYYRLMTEVYRISNMPHFSKFIVKDVE